MPRLQLLVLVACLLAAIHADVYLHMPRGSNNRLNEASVNRANANRLFDSQNNNKGGYNVGIGAGGAQQNEELVRLPVIVIIGS
jgi:hypothetical protein